MGGARCRMSGLSRRMSGLRRTLFSVPVAPVTPPPSVSLVRRARKIDRILAETYPDAKAELDFDNAFECLVVTVLSAQTTDKRVNAVRPTLFAAFPDAKAQQTTALLDGGTAKAMGETAKFLKEQGKVETVLPDYSPYVSAKFVAE